MTAMLMIAPRRMIPAVVPGMESAAVHSGHVRRGGDGDPGRTLGPRTGPVRPAARARRPQLYVGSRGDGGGRERRKGGQLLELDARNCACWNYCPHQRSANMHHEVMYDRHAVLLRILGVKDCHRMRSSLLGLPAMGCGPGADPSGARAGLYHREDRRVCTSCLPTTGGRAGR
jgi:hypothetical protein